MPVKRSMTPQQAMIIGFATLILIGTLLLILPISSTSDQSIGFINAFFTATSAVCVTGLTVLQVGTDFSIFGQVVILILVQIGGLGYMTFGVLFAIALGKRITLKNRLILKEMNGHFPTQSIIKLALRIIMIALSLEIIAALVLTLRWQEEFGFLEAMYQAIFHSIMGFNSAGFSLFPDSLSAYVGDPVVNITITLLIILGGLGFTVILDINQKRNWRKLSLHSKLVLSTYLILTVIGFITIFMIESLNSATFGTLTLQERLWASWFQAVTPRSGGFNTIDPSAMMSTSLILLMFLMFIGAGSGSTGGGIKVNTFAVLIMKLVSVVKGNSDVNVFKRRINNAVVSQAIAVIMLSFSILVTVTLLLTVTERVAHHEFLAILFEATSAFGAVGLSMGVTPDLSVAGKLIITLTMFVGRLGPLTFAFAMTLRARKTHIRYPDDHVMIG